METFREISISCMKNLKNKMFPRKSMLKYFAFEIIANIFNQAME